MSKYDQSKFITPKEKLDYIYSRYLNASGVATQISNVKSGCLYFSITPHRPSSKLKLLIWKCYTFFEIYTPNLVDFMLAMVSRVIKNTNILFKLDRLREKKLNGNAEAPLALKMGACAAVVDCRKYKGPMYIYVPSVERCFHDLAKYHSSCKDVMKIAITGSCGKTTTKELINAVISKEIPTYCTPDSYNTLLGVSNTVLDAKTNIKALVVEISSPGNDIIYSKCKIVQPGLGIITCIGKAHLEGFGDIDGVIKIKRQLFDYIVENKGFFFANIDDRNIVKIVGDYPSVWTYGQSPSAYIRGEAIENNPFLKVRWSLPENLQDQTGQTFLDIQTHLFGAYNLSNVLAAIAVGAYLGISVDNIRHGIESYIPQNHRSQILPIADVTFIMDAYNANPTSMNAALDDFANLEAPQKIAILGDMLELGHHSLEEHTLVVDKLATMNLDAVYFVGKEFGRAGADKVGQNFRSAAQLADSLSHDVLRHAHVLVKGSRGIGLERILKRFDFPFGEDDA